MNNTALEIIQSVNETLSDQVLSEMEPKSWTASKLRSCIVLLTYLEDLLQEERSVLVKSNREMYDFLTEQFFNSDNLTLTDKELFSSISTSLMLFKGHRHDDDIDYLRSANRNFKRLLVRLINSKWRTESKGSVNMVKLHDCLNSVKNLEACIGLRSKDLPPL